MDNSPEIKNVVNVNLDSKDLDEAIEKVSQLKNLLLEIKEIINSLNGLDSIKNKVENSRDGDRLIIKG